MIVLYRISDGSNASKVKLPNATKRHCLENFLTEFPSEIVHLYADKVKPETLEWLKSLGCRVTETSSKGNSLSFLNVVEEALKLPDSETVYFVEDDYLHLPNSFTVLEEGLRMADYVSLYDHPDKYLPRQLGGNPFVEYDGGEVTKVYLSKTAHWKLTNSTTMTFATKVSILREDYEVWKRHCQDNIPHDFDAFIELREKGRSLITPIPGYSTHCETKWTSPLTDWDTI